MRKLAATSICLAGAFLYAQQDTTFSTGVKVVSVLATVRNAEGQIIKTLTKEDFRLAEDDRPQAIRYFSRETDLPLTLGLLVDTSMSQRRVLADESRASYKFLQQVMREDKDQAFVIHFDREIELLQDLTSSRKKLEESLKLLEVPDPQSWQQPRRFQAGTFFQFPGGGGRGGGRRGGAGGPANGGIHRAGGGTTLYDAVLLAANELMKQQTGRKALVILSDGVDNGSKVSLTEAIAAAQHADTLTYSILFSDAQAYGGALRARLGGGNQSATGKKVMQRISERTGGGFFEVSKSLSIDTAFAQLQEELRSQYSLGYTSDRLDAAAGFRHITLTAKQSGLIVQTRDGYFADK